MAVNQKFKFAIQVIVTKDAVLLLLLLLACADYGSCRESVYFPMSSVKFNLPFNEKSESIFSKIPIGKFQILPNGIDGAETETAYSYVLGENSFLRVNASTGEVYMKSDYQKPQNNTKIILTATDAVDAKTPPNKIAQMTLEVMPQDENVYCSNLENICFWSTAQYRIYSNTQNKVSVSSAQATNDFQLVRVGSINPLATRYLCSIMDVKYTLKGGGKYFLLKNNEIYAKILPLAYENLNATQPKNFAANIDCMVKVDENVEVTFNRNLQIALFELNHQNSVQLQGERELNFLLEHGQVEKNHRTKDISAEQFNRDRNFIIPSIISTYPKDVYIQRTAMPYSRVVEPENFWRLMEMPEIQFMIAEDRSGAFDVTPTAGIVYVKNTTALEQAPETIYFLNITWNDAYQRSFVVNVHFVNGQPSTGNVSCDQKKPKPRSQSCAQFKYRKQCIKFCGFGTNGGTCQWRGIKWLAFSRNYSSCVPDAKHCPDNICDPLESLNPLICPQDCIAGDKIIGPHATNHNNRGIFAANGMCSCEDDNGKCVCGATALNEEGELRAKRKRKNETNVGDAASKISNGVAVVSKIIGHAATTGNYTNSSNAVIKHDAFLGIQVAGFVCDRSCIILAVACPIVLCILIICFIVSQHTLKRRTRGKAVSTHRVFVNGSCDLSLIQLESDHVVSFGQNDSTWEFDRAKLQLDALLGEGEFGKVFKGYATNITHLPGITTVAVKMLKKADANSLEYMALQSEFQLLQQVSHPNVIKLLGACTKGNEPMIIIEFAKYGSLLSYLRLSRKLDSLGDDYTADGMEPVTVKDILSFAWQICEGMSYLTEIKLVHRDLAARNILLADGKVCKISDFGLTRDVYEEDDSVKRGDKVPVKWMAPESLADHIYTTKSDVWSFGVLCWELITLGASPYLGISTQNIYHLLKGGYRMERPENCSEIIYSIVRACWTEDPNTRPSFKCLASQFQSLLDYKIANVEKNININSDLIKPEADEFKKPCEHLWQRPKICYDSNQAFSNTISMEFQEPPPGYDVPRPINDFTTTKTLWRYENDLRLPLNIRKSLCTSSTMAHSRYGRKGSCDGGGVGGSSRCGGVETISDHYSVLVKRGHSYMDMTNKTFIPDNLDSLEFEKHLSKTISFRFSSLLNLKEQPEQQEPHNQGEDD